MASSITCSEGWRLTERDPGPLPRPGLKLTGVFLGVLAVGWLVRLILNTTEVARVGDRAPDFTVPLLDGGSFTLSNQLELDDRVIVLNLWASWCIPCRIETPELSAFAASHPEIKVIGVAVQDTESEARRFAAEFKPSYDLAMGDQEFRMSYPSLRTLPATYIIEPNGRVAHIINGMVTNQLLEDLVD